MLTPISEPTQFLLIFSPQPGLYVLYLCVYCNILAKTGYFNNIAILYIFQYPQQYFICLVFLVTVLYTTMDSVPTTETNDFSDYFLSYLVI